MGGRPRSALPGTLPRSEIRIHYLRPNHSLDPEDRERVYVQDLIHEDGRVMVTHARSLAMAAPLLIDGVVALESGSDAIWFTFPGAWHDIGRFHQADGSFTGIYANILIPCVFAPGDWHTTDLFLDLWIPASQGFGADGTPKDEPHPTPTLLDENELDEAEGAGWLAPELASRAREEARRLIAEAEAGRWPPPVVYDWTLERVRARS
jgi:predicted RNA-binding protein associated with RNAse of E/G family